MNIGDIKTLDVLNGPGVRVSIFVTGCTHACPGCFNAEIQDRNAGRPYTEDDEKTIIDTLASKHVTGLTLLGGEPMQNTKGLIPLVKKVRDIYGDSKTIWCYSGYKLEHILKIKTMKELLSYCDVLVDGKYEQEYYIPNLFFRGSKNQRIINVRATLDTGKINYYNDGHYTKGDEQDDNN